MTRLIINNYWIKIDKFVAIQLIIRRRNWFISKLHDLDKPLE